MKLSKTNFLCLFLTVLMVIGLTACNEKRVEAPKEEKPVEAPKDEKQADTPEDSNLIKLGDHVLRYKSACIMKDTDEKEAVVLTLDFTNNSEEKASYHWRIDETASQDGTDLEGASVVLDYKELQSVMNTKLAEVDPGKTLEVKTAFVLKDTKNPVNVQFEQMYGDKNGQIKIDVTKLERVEIADLELTAATTTATTSTSPTTTSSTTKTTTTKATATAAKSTDPLLDWWNGKWFGWWKMTGCSGTYEGMEGNRWDVNGLIDIGKDYTGTVKLWDEDYTEEEPTAKAKVSLNEAGTGKHGTLMSEGGWFTNIDLKHADWIVDPGLMEKDNLICIDGWYEDGDDEYHYEFYLRPWGTRWDDVEEDFLPNHYEDWYLPLIEEDKTTSDKADASTTKNKEPEKTEKPTPASTVSGAAPSGGTGIITEEQVQKGYVWMNEVAKDIFNTTYEELSDYFGVEGEFDKEAYSDHMKANYRYYRWVSEENDSHFIYVNFKEEEPGIYKISAYNSSGFSSKEATSKYLDILKAEEADRDRAAVGSTAMKDFSVKVAQFAHDEVNVTIQTTIPTKGWSYDEGKRRLVENDDPDRFGAGAIRFEVRKKVEDFDYYKKDFKNYQEIEDRTFDGISFRGRTYKNIGYDWIEYIAQIDDGRALSIGLQNLPCEPGTMTDVILTNIKIK